MDTWVAPTYVNLSLWNTIKRKHIYSHERCLRILFRFIDDIWSIFRGSVEELIEFLAHCNSICNIIKFMITYFKEGISFLDVNNIQKTIQSNLHPMWNPWIAIATMITKHVTLRIIKTALYICNYFGLEGIAHNGLNLSNILSSFTPISHFEDTQVT